MQIEIKIDNYTELAIIKGIKYNFQKRIAEYIAVGNKGKDYVQRSAYLYPLSDRYHPDIQIRKPYVSTRSGNYVRWYFVTVEKAVL